MRDDAHIGFLGAGNMGEALALGLVRDGGIPGDRVILADIREDVVADLSERLGVIAATSNADLVERSTIVVLAVKPQVLTDVLASIADRFRPGHHTVLSIAAGVTIATLERALPEGVAVVRAMPNTPSLVGRGASCYALGRHAGADARRIADAILGSVGLAREVEEAELEAVTALSGSGPAYFFYLMEAMIDASVAAGLHPELAEELTLHTALGAATLAFVDDAGPGELRRRVTSPGGTTEAAIAAFDAAGLRETIAAGMAANRARNRALAGDDA